METDYVNNSIICSQGGCPFKTSGICLEGLKISDCPHLHYQEIYDEKDELIATPATAPVSRNVSLFIGEELQDADLPPVTMAYPVQLIIILGEAASGKTTLLAALFDQFQKGLIGNYMFAGSRTQIGFEKRCHLARFKLFRKNVDTERTKSVEFSYLHLAVKNKQLNSSIKHILLSDVSGERFRLARDYEEEMKRLTILNQADKLFYVVDGDQLTDSIKRHSVKQNIYKFFDRILQSKFLSEDKKICLIITKWDIVKDRKQESNVEKFLIDPMKKKYPILLGDSFSVCARAVAKTEIRSGYGLDIFLQKCLEDDIRTVNSNVTSLNTSIMREFGRYALL